MARKRRSSSQTNVPAGRDDLYPIARLRPPVLLQEFEDRRTYQPDPAPKPVKLVQKAAVRGAQIKPKRAPSRQARRSLIPSGLQFADPQKVLICIRREQRRRSIFATKRFGRNGGRRYRRNQHSQISCR